MSTSASKRVDEALRLLERGAPLRALPPACAAIESSAHRELPKVKDLARRYHTWFAAYGWAVERAALPGALPARLAGFEAHPTLPKDAEGRVAREAVLTEVLRTSLVYAARLEPHVRVEADGPPRLAYLDGVLVVPARLPLGFALAAIVCAANAGQHLDRPTTVTIAGRPVDLDALWGEADMARTLLGRG